MNVQQVIQEALRCHQLGDLKQAEFIYRQVLAVEPNNVDALHLLGALAYQSGNYQAAIALIQKAISFNKKVPEFYNNLGNAFRDAGELKEAIGSYKKALKLRPGYAEAHNNLGNAYKKMEMPDDAIASYKRAIAYDPVQADPYNNLGVIFWEQKKTAESIEHFRKAIGLNGGFVKAHYNLGNLLLDQNKIDEAIAAFRCALEIDPNHADAQRNLGAAFTLQGRNEDALHCYRRALELVPDSPGIYSNFGIALSELGRLKEAEEAYFRALELKPDYAAAHSALLAMRGYHLQLPPREMLEAARQWEEKQVGSVPIAPHGNVKVANRKLRIGYVSPDFHGHAVSYFIEPVIEHHDSAKVEVYCYNLVDVEDEVTVRLREKADHWRSLVGLDDSQAAELIRQDRIDVLVDLAGHTANNRLRVFGYKPAPVQATYLGYYATTGLSAMDYWISDEVLHPRDTVEETSEAIFRLSRCWLCYRPPVEVPEVVPAPSQGAAVTFGSFNNLGKVSGRAIALWSRVLQAVPGSRLLLKTKQLADVASRERICSAFREEGIGEERLILTPHSDSFRDHMGMYGKVDIALDTLPYTGGTTTADALWMGVPVITLAGGVMLERMGASMLSAIGRPEWIAKSEEEYVEKAAALAKDPGLRASLRTALRERMAKSPLCDAKRLASALEEAYSKMWESYLESKGNRFAAISEIG